LFARKAPVEAPELMARLEPMALDFAGRTLRAMSADGLPAVTGLYDFRAVHLVYAVGAPGRPFDAGEWRVFRDAYLSVVDLTGQERNSWPDALDHVLWEEGTFIVEEDDEWEVPNRRAFLLDFLTTPQGAYPLE
jgi:spectinomycin phosphotransferase